MSATSSLRPSLAVNVTITAIWSPIGFAPGCGWWVELVERDHHGRSRRLPDHAGSRRSRNEVTPSTASDCSAHHVNRAISSAAAWFHGCSSPLYSSRWVIATEAGARSSGRCRRRSGARSATRSRADAAGGRARALRRPAASARTARRGSPRPVPPRGGGASACPSRGSRHVGRTRTRPWPSWRNPTSQCNRVVDASARRMAVDRRDDWDAQPGWQHRRPRRQLDLLVSRPQNRFGPEVGADRERVAGACLHERSDVRIGFDRAQELVELSAIAASTRCGAAGG
jgi:hypothetical protein